MTLSRNRSPWIGPRGSAAWAGDAARLLLVLRARPASAPPARRRDAAAPTARSPVHQARPRRLGCNGGEVGAGDVHPRQHACRRLRAVGGVGREVVLARQAVDHRGGLALEREQEAAGGVGLRPGHRQAAVGQVLHQLQVERQLARRSGARTASARSAPRWCRRSSWCSRCRRRRARARAGRRCRAPSISAAASSKETSVKTAIGNGAGRERQNVSTFQTRLPAAPREVSAAVGRGRASRRRR